MRQLIQSTLSIVWLLSLSGVVCGAADYKYQGPDYTTIAFGTQFSTTDSLSGAMRINNPPLGGTCNGLGSGTGQCDITGLSFTSTGTPPLSIDLHTYDPGSSFLSQWSFSFDGVGAITEWGVILRTLYLDGGRLEIWTHLLTSSFGAFGTNANSDLGGEASSPQSVVGRGVWAAVPEPSAFVLCFGFGLMMVGWSHRRY